MDGTWGRNADKVGEDRLHRFSEESEFGFVILSYGLANEVNLIL